MKTQEELLSELQTLLAQKSGSSNSTAWKESFEAWLVEFDAKMKELAKFENEVDTQ